LGDGRARRDRAKKKTDRDEVTANSRMAVRLR
jgi:hypothetical protein